MSSRFWPCWWVLGLLVVSRLAAQDFRVQQQVITLGDKPLRWVADEIVVKFKPHATGAQHRALHAAQGTAVLHTNRVLGFERLRLPAGKTAAQLLAAYRADPRVDYAELNYYAQALFVPNDPYFSYEWHLDDSVKHGIHMQAAWDIEKGDPRVIIAVVDTGVAYETYGGFVQAGDLAATSFVPGYNFIDNTTHANDDNGHGTHVTGTIAQNTNNLTGVAGVAFLCSIMPVKVLDSAGSGTYTDIADGVQFAADNGAKVINLSLGGTADSATLSSALSYAVDKGVTIVCAAGNEYQEGNPTIYPAAYDAWCIAVGATRYDQKRAYYSSTGTYVDLVAPGGDTSVDQNHDGYGDGVLQQTFSVGDPTSFVYWFIPGTSMAAPHVSGTAALLIARGVQGPDHVRQALQDTADDLGRAGYDTTYGWGLVDAAAALSYFTPGDVNADHYVDLADVVVLGQEWLTTGPPPLYADVNNDGIVNLLDFQVLATNWSP